MFSKDEKIMIAQKVEELLLSLKHPEMPDEKPKFHLHIDGKESWSWADIEPNWTFEAKEPGVNQWNEDAREILNKNECMHVYESIDGDLDNTVCALCGDKKTLAEMDAIMNERLKELCG